LVARERGGRELDARSTLAGWNWAGISRGLAERRELEGSELKAPGPQTKLNDVQRLALKEIVEAGPIPAVHGVVRRRLIDLVQWLYEEFAVSLDETTVGRELKAMGFRKLSARPRHHAQNEFAVEAFKKPSCRDGGDPGAAR